MWARSVHSIASVLQYGHVLLETWLAARVCSLSRDLSGIDELQKVWLATRQEYIVAHPQVEV